METWEAITSRRNVRTYDDRSIDRADLSRILEAGRRAPSAGNSQPWDFVVCTARDRLVELATVWRSAGHVAHSAATIALVLVEGEEQGRMMAQYDLGQATMAMELTAADLGIASAHAAVGDQEKARGLLGIPDGHYCAYLLALGYPGDRPLAPIQKPKRRPFDEVVHWGRW